MKFGFRPVPHFARLAVFGALVLTTACSVLGAQAGTASGGPEIVSVTNRGEAANQTCSGASMSADGRFVAFCTFAANLPHGTPVALTQVFLRDRQQGTTTLISRSPLGERANNHCDHTSMSADGRFIAYDSTATNLVADDTNGDKDVFLYDRQADSTSRVSLASDGSQALGGESSTPVISADGRHIAFTSHAANLPSAAGDGTLQVYVRDLDPSSTELVSVNDAGVAGNFASDSASISGDGRVVAFCSEATNLAAGDRTFFRDVFVRLRDEGVTRLASVSGGGEGGNGASTQPSLSADGTVLAYTTLATNLALGSVPGLTAVVARRLDTGETRLVSVGTTGAWDNAGSSSPVTSADGRCVAFLSSSTSFTENPPPTSMSLYVHDLRAGITARVSAGPSWHSLVSLRPVALTVDDATLLCISDDNLLRGGLGYREVVLAPFAMPLLAVPDSFQAQPNTLLTVAAPGVLDNDGGTPSTLLGTLLVRAPEHGTVGLQPDGSFSYQPAPAFRGYDSFAYEVQTPLGVTNVATVVLLVGGADNHPPTAYAGPWRHLLPAGTYTPVTLDGSGSSDPDGELLGYTWREAGVPVGEGVSPTVYLTKGEHTLELTVIDGSGATATSAVGIKIAPNSPPVGVADSYIGPVGQPIILTTPGVLRNDSNPDFDGLTVRLISTTAHGILNLNADGSFLYTPDAGYRGPDAFVYRPADDLSEGGDTLVTLYLANAGNHAPVADASATPAVVEATGLLTPVTLDPSRSSDADGDELTYAWYFPLSDPPMGPKPVVYLPVGQAVEMLVVTDPCGAVAVTYYTVNVVDNQPPVLVCPADMRVPQNRPGGALVNFAVTATDNVAAEKPTTIPPSGSIFPLGTTRVACYVRDTRGLSATRYFRITVEKAPSTRGGKIAGSGSATGAVSGPDLPPGSQGTFQFKFAVSVPAHNSKPAGKFSFKRKGFVCESQSITSLEVRGREATLFGTARVNGKAHVGFQVFAAQGISKTAVDHLSLFLATGEHIGQLAGPRGHVRISAPGE